MRTDAGMSAEGCGFSPVTVGGRLGCYRLLEENRFHGESSSDFSRQKTLPRSIRIDGGFLRKANDVPKKGRVGCVAEKRGKTDSHGGRVDDGGKCIG